MLAVDFLHPFIETADIMDGQCCLKVFPLTKTDRSKLFLLKKISVFWMSDHLPRKLTCWFAGTRSVSRVTLSFLNKQFNKTRLKICQKLRKSEEQAEIGITVKFVKPLFIFKLVGK